MTTFNFDPFPELETERFQLVRIMPEHEDTLFALRSDPEILRYINRDPYTDSAQAREFISLVGTGIEQGRNLYWMLRQKSDGKLIGSLCMWNFSDDGKQAEIGYDLLRPFQGLGIMTEAVPVLLEYGFSALGFDALQAFIQPPNDRSIKLVERFGFKRIGNSDDGNDIYQLEKSLWSSGTS